MGTRSSLACTEVPIIGTDSVRWVQVSVPAPSSSVSFLPAPNSTPAEAPPPLRLRDVASCSIIGEPPTYLIWRIHKSDPQALEIMELCPHKEFPRIGIRIRFPDALFPFAFICGNETDLASGSPYLLYALTVSGVAYLFRIKSIDNFVSSVFQPNEMIEFRTQNYFYNGSITSVAATAGCLVIGRSDGSVTYFLLGTLDPTAPGFVNELRDDAGLGRLWGLMSRGRVTAAVQDLVVLRVHGKKLLFALHSDGILRVWDLVNRCKIYNYTLSVPSMAGAIFKRLWLGEAHRDSSEIPLAILSCSALGVGMEMICMYRLQVSLLDKLMLLLEPTMLTISLEEGELVDVKLTSNKMWILKEDGLVLHLFGTDRNGGVAHCYTLQEAFVADQLFQGPEHSPNDLLWLAHTILPSLKDQIAPFVSSIFLRRLLVPGVYHSTVLRVSLQEYNKHFSDSEFHSFTVDGLKREILSIIEHQCVSGSAVSILYCWKNFCTSYFDNWCKGNAACGLWIDSTTGALGLIRKNSVSLFRCLEDVEILLYDSFDEIGGIMSSGLHFSDNELEREILIEVFRCINSISQQLGKAASAILYESLLSTPNISSEDVIPHLLKILETGYNSSIAAFHASDLGADVAWEKEGADHKRLRKFSVDMLLSLHSLCSKATEWSRVLDVIQSYLKCLVPRKFAHKENSKIVFGLCTSITVQATSQVAKVMFESALDIRLFLSYLVNRSGQIHMVHDDVSRIQLELVPMIQEIVTEWHIIHYFGTTPSESPAFEDFSSQLSSLQIDSNMGRRSWNEKLGKCDFMLASILLLNIQSSSEEHNYHSFRCLPNPSDCISLARDFTSWIIWGRTGEESSVFFSHSTELASILLRHGQYDAVEYLLMVVDAHTLKERISHSLQSADGKLGLRLHLLGCCLLAQAQRGSHGMLKEKKVCEAARCFFRAASMEQSPQVFQSLSDEAAFGHVGFTGCASASAWKLHYYQWAMQIFEQYNMSEAACQFAVAALEQVDEALGPKDDTYVENPLNESATSVKGRLWANIFKFTLDLNYYHDAYCAIISNPDEESQSICLRRFIIVLYECGAVKVLCGNQLPFIGLVERVERELAWKAERSDVSAKPNPYKLLYAFEMHLHNWRRAASYIYLYSAHLGAEAATKDLESRSYCLQERLNGLSAAINALHLVRPAYAWIDPLNEETSLWKEHYPSKKARTTMQEQSGNDVQPQKLQSYVDIEKLEKEYLLTSAEYLLSLANVKWAFSGNGKPPPELVDLLIESNLYDLAFMVLLKLWKGSGMKRELERVFVVMSWKCIPSRQGPQSIRNDHKLHGRLLTSSEDEEFAPGSLDIDLSAQQFKGNGPWETLEVYLEKYLAFHPRLPVIVAETLLSADPQIELPRWLVQMFKKQGIRRENCWGMAGSESNSASLFRLYVDYGRYVEATNLLIEYLESFASMRPGDIIHRKRPCAVWFPYTLIERLWCQLDESIRLGHMINQCEKLKKLLHGALLNHLNILKVDSVDAQSSVVQ